jgi:hypothetical protein
MTFRERSQRTTAKKREIRSANKRLRVALQSKDYALALHEHEPFPLWNEIG